MAFPPNSGVSDVAWDRHRGHDILGHDAAVDFMYRYWERLNTGPTSPQRKDISPSHFARLLPHVALLEVTCLDPLDLTFRLMGTNLASVFGELTGKSIHNVKQVDALTRALSTIAMVIENKEPFLNVSPTLDQGRTYLKIAALYCPLFDDQGDVAMLLATLLVSRRTLTDTNH